MSHMTKIKYIKTVSAAKAAVEDILVKGKPVIGVKCLGCNVGERDGRITFVVFGSWEGNVYVFDIAADKAIMYEGGVLRLLQSAELLKVFHNCTPDSGTLFRQFGIHLKNVFDTQVAYATIMERQRLTARRLSFEKICDVHRLHIFIPSPKTKRLMVEDMNFWARRPCTQEMLKVAASYVQPLVPNLFRQTDGALPPETDEWFMYQCEQNRLALLPANGPKLCRDNNQSMNC